MPKKIWFVLGVFVLGLSALSGLSACDSNSDIYDDVAPTAAPTAIPTGTEAAVTAQYNGVALANQSVIETTELNGAPNTTIAPIATQITNSDGQTTFTGLTPGATYCWYFDYVVNSTTTTRQSACTNDWATGLLVGS